MNTTQCLYKLISLSANNTLLYISQVVNFITALLLFIQEMGNLPMYILLIVTTQRTVKIPPDLIVAKLINMRLITSKHQKCYDSPDQ